MLKSSEPTPARTIERNPTRRAAEIARQQWGLALAEMDDEGQRYEVIRMLEEAVESVKPAPGLKEILRDLSRDFARRT
jgi:beta-phosphoglucomutase-like phosphatase (HAD superfamily)